ncbi:MAG: ornithine decarboxylase [Veillonellaceae bacterium]|nr:ornithine decarboxylase [Veillonellaceae bacterium]
MLISPLAVSASLLAAVRAVLPAEAVLIDSAVTADAAAAVLTADDPARARWEAAQVPVSVLTPAECTAERLAGVLAQAEAYEQSLLPPFVSALVRYTAGDQTSLATPGHHGGEFFRRTRAGRLYYDFYGPAIFRTDISSSDAGLGDILTHEGMAAAGEEHAAKVFHADRTYFVLNGTSAANKVCTNALLTPGDLVLFDRNNHKSVHHGALIQAGATPVYLETTRNAYGFIGGMPSHCLNEESLRKRVAEIDPARQHVARPFRLAVFQLGTYDGILYNAAEILERVGHLCDYILFDSAWVGYEQFLPILAEMSPLTLALDESSPGILVTQSVHKQLAGFSQTSQIHKKDKHLQGQARRVSHDQFNNAYLLHASTSPSYPLFASLDMNAGLHEAPHGEELWLAAATMATETKKDMLRRLKYFRPFVPPTVDGIAWEDIPTETILADRKHFALDPEATWHGFSGIRAGQYCLDPCKILLATPGIRVADRAYEDFGVPGAVVSKYLQSRHLTPEKSDLNSLLFLITPAESAEKMTRLVDLLAELEAHLDADTPLREVIPAIWEKHRDLYADYGIRRLCRELHDFYRRADVAHLQQALFARDQLPPIAMPAQAANIAFQRGEGELLPLAKLAGRIALEGALPYPPGILTVVPGERWTDVACRYFAALEEGIRNLPGFEPEIQGMHLRPTADGPRLFAYVLKE